MKPNRMKEKIRAGEPAFGVSIMIPSPQIVEMVGRLGFDWVLLDCEHGTLGPETVEILCLAAEASGLTPIARPRSKAPEDILQVLDRGAMGVQVPHINNAEDARRAVQAARYHPLGTRSLAAGTRPAEYGLTISPAEYVEQVNREILVCVQIEDAEALHHMDEILRVEGVDVFFVGPSDLGQSLGYPGRSNVPEVRAAIDKAFAAIVAAGKIPGSAGNAKAVAEFLSKGCLYVYTHVPSLLAAGAAEFMRTVKG